MINKCEKCGNIISNQKFLIEKTDKKYKLGFVISFLLIIISLSVFFYGIFNYNKNVIILSIIMGGISIGIWMYSKIMSWWHHS